MTRDGKKKKENKKRWDLLLGKEKNKRKNKNGESGERKGGLFGGKRKRKERKYLQFSMVTIEIEIE